MKRYPIKDCLACLRFPNGLLLIHPECPVHRPSPRKAARDAASRRMGGIW